MTPPNSTSPIDIYRKHVEQMFEENSTILFSNKDKDHAAVLVSTIFDRAKDEVLVLCRNFDSQFYDNELVSQAVLKAAARGVKVKIKVQESPENGSLLKELNSGKFSNVTFQICRGSAGRDTAANFTVADRTSFRLEEDRREHAAVACANNPQIARGLASLFEALG